MKFELVAKGHECESGDEIYHGYQPSVSACAKKCYEQATMFIFGTAGHKCNSDGHCACYCEKSGTPAGDCDLQDDFKYDAYKFV